MKQSRLFPRTEKHAPRGETSVNAQLLERAGYIAKLMAGVYSYLPLGLRVLNKINGIIREEMNALGGQELFLPALQPKELWEKTKRWDGLREVMYQFQDHSKKDVGLAITHEEVVADLAKRYIHSYKDLPFAVYQIQTKFRHELRAKSGLTRGREFCMKDLYSFHATEEDLEGFYQSVKTAYVTVFRRCGLEVKIVEASGGDFSKEFSHEFQVLTDIGEDTILWCTECHFAQNKEIAKVKKDDRCFQCKKGTIRESRAIEVGNIFKLGTKYSEPLGAAFIDEKGEKKSIIMASYGIGPSRVMGTIVEIHHDEKGICWPASVSPFAIHLLAIGKSETMLRKADALYAALRRKGIEVLYDERDLSAGEKLHDADLLGINTRAVVSDRNGSLIEVCDRKSKEVQHLGLEQLLDYLAEQTVDA